MLSALGFIMIVLIVVLVLKNKTSAFIGFGLIPIVFALLCGFSPVEISKFAVSGYGKVSSVVMMFVFSITYFGVMADAGMFDAIVKAVTKKCGDNRMLITIATVIIAIVGHLDGAGATTYLIVIPAMLPIYKKMNMRVTTLFLLTAATVGVANAVPWGGTLTRAAITIDMDPTVFWKKMIPIQLFGFVLVFAMAYIFGKQETKLCSNLKNVSKVEEESKVSEEVLALRRPKLVGFNIIFTLVMIAVLVWGKIATQLVFMVALGIALLVNYRDVKSMSERIAAHSAEVHPIIVMLLGCGVFLGIIQETGMIEAMTKTLVSIVPASMGKAVHVILALVGSPIAMAFGPDPFYYGILPIVVEMCGHYGVAATSVAIAFTIVQNAVCAISPAVPPAYLLYGLSGLELKDGIKASFLWLWAMGAIMVIFGIIIGIIGF